MISWAAPGRINLIGEHTDYNLGFALPIALPERTIARFAPADTDVLTVHSDHLDGAVDIRLDTRPGDVEGWAAYVAGVVWALRAAGHPVTGGTLRLTSTVLIGAGLSSSAALECATLGALTASGPELDRITSARIAQRAENEYVGAPTGLLDQLSSLFGEPRRALLIDFRDVTVEPVPFDPEAAGVTLLVINSHAVHEHAGGEYAARRTSCERAARDLGVASLREVCADDSLDPVRDPVDARRARHIVTENARVHDFVAAVRASDFAAAGRLMTESHASMRDDFEITTPHLDAIAASAVAAGAFGARMTGGGFGGCVIVLVPTDRAGSVTDAVEVAMRDGGYRAPTVTATHAAAGAGRVRTA
ncbi:galactokinase [Mycolicibacterium sediminis]|uniref:Galactokinase n=1 Tax=Mycolicibacterium sediminis TaxID=1286180 RepID=A0A7I7QJJ1_9MYCO|nr:galactokinase [Mycolicibacterium sediminis]BBY26412.1 galactokinase [Mycolicibacterium sediminis]